MSNNHNNKTETSWLKCSEVREILKQVEIDLEESIPCSDSFVEEVCGHVTKAGGKRLQPSLVLLAARYGDANNPSVIRMAVAMELMHLATLYHDGIVDDATTPRGRQGVNSIW